MRSESLGMVLDRLSILALREYHLEEDAARKDASPEDLAAAEEKLGFVREQREVLTRCLDGLLNAPEGRRLFPFLACKLYNDPATNPQLYAPDSSEGSRSKAVPALREALREQQQPTRCNKAGTAWLQALPARYITVAEYFGYPKTAGNL